ncbi:MAG: AlbA family DNA-binding domain-containing protein [Acidimicrobiales bacterium]
MIGALSAPSPQEIEILLVEGREAELIGIAESDRLDFKQSPHQLATDRGKWELAKDVAALANSGGGALVVGIATTIPEDTEEEIASEVTLFPAGLASVKQHRDVLDAKSGVYPTVRDVTIRRFDRPEGKALLLIVVPAQEEDQQPYMVLRMVEGDEKRGVGIGVPFRSGPHTFWLSPGELHRDLSDGRRARTQPLIEVPSVPAAPPPEPLNGMTDRRLVEIEQYVGWEDSATYLLAAVPIQGQPAPLPGMYDPNRIYGCVSHPPEIRSAGFSLAWRETPRNEDGALVNLISGRSVLWVEPDGTCLAAAAGTPAFLGRASRVPAEPQPQEVNPTVLVEWTYLFCLFVEQCMSGAVEGGWRFAARLRGARSRPWSLRLQPGRDRTFWEDGREPGMDDWFAELSGTGDAGLDAYNLLTGVYSIFGLDSTAIPFVTDGRIDPDAIRAIKG